jgi:glyoxylase-like metal-dependent hydrolase (beta-lactamase superfamily II)
MDIPVIGPQKEDAFLLENLPVQAEMFGFPPTEAFVPTQWLQDGDRVEIGETILEVIHCPGHTPGHVVFLGLKERIAFVGDVLFKGSIGRTDFARGNHAALLHSIREKLFPLGDDIRFIPGHGPLSTFGQERLSNPFVSDRAVTG